MLINENVAAWSARGAFGCFHGSRILDVSFKLVLEPGMSRAVSNKLVLDQWIWMMPSNGEVHGRLLIGATVKLNGMGWNLASKLI